MKGTDRSLVLVIETQRHLFENWRWNMEVTLDANNITAGDGGKLSNGSPLIGSNL